MSLKSKKKKKRSAILLKLQIPVAIVLGIVFVFLLNARLRGSRAAGGAEQRPANDAAVIEETVEVNSDGRRIDSLLDTISGEGREDSSHATTDEMPGLRSDPFADPKATAGTGVIGRLRQISGEILSQRGSEDDRERYGGKTREDFIETLTLQATLKDGDLGIAMINDRLYAESFSVGPFRLLRVGERVALLADDAGRVLLTMKGDEEQ